jgi:uncharacterized protein YfeS
MDEFTRKSTAHMDQKLVKQAIKAIDKSPELKKIRSIKDGMAYSEINTGVNDQQYKDNYDKITWNKDKPKPKFKVRVNGKVINDEEE